MTTVPAFIPISLDEDGKERIYISIRNATGADLARSAAITFADDHREAIQAAYRLFVANGGKPADRVRDILDLAD
jgi:hypothetical protein